MPITETLLNEFFSTIGRIASPDSEDPHSQGPAGFDPKFIAIVHLRSRQAWDLQIVHAHFAYPGANTPQDRLAFACQIIEGKLAADAAGSWTFNYPGAINTPVVNPSNNLIAEYRNFSRFGFAHPHDIFFFFEDGDLQDRLQFLPSLLFRFDESFADGSKADDNHAFFGGSLVTANASQAVRSNGQLLRLSNKFTKHTTHSPINPGKDKFTYKLNLVYSPVENVFMLIDPDTGNGMGNYP